MKIKHWLGALIPALLFGCVQSLVGTEYFVSTEGDDSQVGTTPAEAFRTFQRGVDALAPGDTLTIRPGQYFESVERADLGNSDVDTVIRAEIPGTVLVRGDVPAPRFEPSKEFPFVYETEFEGAVQSVLEHETTSRLVPMPNPAELEVEPGAFHYDPATRKLYISPTGLESPEGRTYTIAVTPASGLTLQNPKRVVIDGLAFTGFVLDHEKPLRDQHGAVWGIWLEHPENCVIRRCTAFLNAGGIGIGSHAEGGGNVIEQCLVYGNGSPFSGVSGIAVYSPNDDVIRDCIAYEEGRVAFRFYLGGAGTALVENSLAAGGAIQMKGGAPLRDHGLVSHSVGLGVVETHRNARSVVGGHNRHRAQAEFTEVIQFLDHEDLEVEKEFADPVNHDFRLQSTSRFRGAGGEGGDLGPFPFKPNVFFLTETGDDADDGLSVSSAWATLGHALSELSSGDTLYIEGGRYHLEGDVKLQGSADAEIGVFGRGREEVVIEGDIRLRESSHLRFKRLRFVEPVAVSECQAVAFENVIFPGNPAGVIADGVAGLRVVQCLFPSPDPIGLQLRGCEQVFLSGNLFGQQTAVDVDKVGGFEFSDYNHYAPAHQGWEIGGERWKPGELPGLLERHSEILETSFFDEQGRLQTGEAAWLRAHGPPGAAPWPVRYGLEEPVRVTAPRLHSVSATTANLEWQTTAAATFQIEWGETPELGNQATVDAYRFAGFSLTDLEPGKIYYFRLKSGVTRHRRTAGIPSEEIDLTPEAREVVTFTTLETDLPPKTYYVSADGDNARDGLSLEAAFRTLNHAAGVVNVGDTVLVSEGVYPEQIRVRSTGTANAPIRFQGLDGQRVTVTGGDKELRTAFVLLHKHHIHVDHFYFESMNTAGPWWPGLRGAGVFNIQNSDGVRVTRCLYDGRGGYSPPFMGATLSADLRVENCVVLSPMGSGFQITRCPGFRFEHSILLRPMIVGMWLENLGSDRFYIRNNIFSDNMPAKASSPLIRFNRGEFLEENNCFILRRADRDPLGIVYGERLDDGGSSVRLDPGFSIYERRGVTGQLEEFLDPEGRSGGAVRLPEDLIMLGANQGWELSFADFFATHPKIMERGIGLQPEAFASYHE